MNKMQSCDIRTPADAGSILDCPCVPFSSIDEAKGRLIKLVEQSHMGGYAVAINAEKIMRYRNDPALRSVVNGSVLPTPDGAGAVLGLRLLCNKLSIKLDLPRTALELANIRRWRVFVAGSTEDVNRDAVGKIQKLYPDIQIAGRINGYVDENSLINAIRMDAPQLLLLALGSPKQELIAARLLEQIPSLFIIGCGGALDVLAGRARRAPKFMVDNNLEWLYRLWKDPSRWKRQMQLPKFLFSLLFHAFVTRRL